MTREQIKAAAEFLRLLRSEGGKTSELPIEIRPHTLAEAYEVQRELCSALGGETDGWFVALTSTEMQRVHRAVEPLYGRILRGNVVGNRATVPLNGLASIEAEIGFRLRSDISSNAVPATLDDLADAIEAVVPVIEIVESRFTDLRTVSLPSLITDNGTDGVIVIGEEMSLASFGGLSGRNVSLRIGGSVAATGTSSNAMGNPLRACLWLAERLSRDGISLQAGDLIVTGNCLAQYAFARPGEDVEVTFDQLGSVVASLHAAECSGVGEPA